MNKLPTKQIYLLSIIIVGIIALSVYSTYALFTFESSTSDIVSIHTPNSLQISENIYEYKQLVVEPNSVTTTDIDIYNGYDYNLCYSIWYKIVGNNIDENKVQIFENSNDVLTSSGILTASNNIRVKVVIINDNDEPTKIKLGTIGSQSQGESCSLNLESDKKVISTIYNNLENLSEKILEEIEKTKEEESNYLTYTEKDEVITYKSTDKLYVSEKFSYEDELFTLEEPVYLTIQEIVDEKYLENKTIYFCKESDKCSILYKITELEQQETEEKDLEERLSEETELEEEIYYDIKIYDKLVGYSKSTNGLRQVNEKDYIYYGDNPDNFIYYNCENNNDTSTCELWRIIGLFYNEEEKYNIKIIRNESIGKYQFNEITENSEHRISNKWLESSLHKYLNEEYKFINDYDNYLEELEQPTERISNLETDIKNMNILDQNITSKVNLLKLSDYLYTSSCQKDKISEYNKDCFKNNWLNNIELESEWTLTSKENVEVIEDTDMIEKEEIIENSKIDNFIYAVDNNIIESSINDYMETRPVVFLKSRMLLLEGDGTFEKPYIIK